MRYLQHLGFVHLFLLSFQLIPSFWYIPNRWCFYVLTWSEEGWVFS
jgi:hypothetical protein